MSEDAGSTRGAVRLVFAYDGDDIRLTARQRVDAIPPPSDPLDGPDDGQGFWADVRDPDGTTIYRRVLHDPVRRDAEVFSDRPDRSLERVAVARPAGVFSLLVPAADGAELAVMSRPPSRPGARSVAAELIRVPL